MRIVLFLITISLLHVSCGRLKTDKGLNSAAYDGDVEKVKLLIENGHDVNGKGWDGDTPLANAIREEHPKIVELLLSNGASIENEFVRDAIHECKNQKIIDLIEHHY